MFFPVRFFVSLCLCGLALQAIAQARGNAPSYNKDYNEQQRSQKANTALPQAHIINAQRLTLDVRVLSNQQANSQLAIFSVTQMGKTAKEATELLQTRRDKFTAALQALGIAKEAIFIDIISFVPIYDYEVENKVFSKTYNELPKGFELQQNLHIGFKDENILPKIVLAAAEQEIYDLVKVDYFVENNAAVYEEMRKKGIAYAQKMIADYKKMGIELDSAHRILAEAKSVVYPDQRYSSYQAFSRAAVPGKGKVEDVRKNTTVYYDKLPYDSFDVIINPELLQPAVQFSYHLRMQFDLPPVQPSVQIKERQAFMWLTPEGELKRLKVE